MEYDQEHYGTGEIGRVNSLGTAWSGAEPSDAGASALCAHQPLDTV